MRICKKRMLPCQTESMCSPFQGCTPIGDTTVDAFMKGYRQGFADAKKVYQQKVVEPGYSGTDWK